jgi:predicted nucleic acid-binding Zn ribbon protein
MMKHFVKIGSVIESSIKRWGLDKGLKKEKILSAWDEIVGEPIASVSRPSYIKGKKLFVCVSDSMWLQELKFLEGMILDKLNQYVGERLIEGIYFKIDTEGKTVK